MSGRITSGRDRPQKDRSRRVVVVSPHFDDVPLSLGQSLSDGALARCRVEVHVAFARTNWTRWLHPTPGRARLVGAWRRGEETVAALRFRYRWRTGRWSEVLLRTGDMDPASFLVPARDLDDEPLVAEVADWLRGLLEPDRRGTPSLLLVSAGLGGHLDHRIVAAAAASLVGSVAVPIGFYEDRPYTAYLEPDELLAQLAVLGPDPEPVEMSGPVQRSTQRRVQRSYPSQIDDYFVDAMERDRSARAGERVWFPRGGRPDWLGR